MKYNYQYECQRCGIKNTFDAPKPLSKTPPCALCGSAGAMTLTYGLKPEIVQAASDPAKLSDMAGYNTPKFLTDKDVSDPAQLWNMAGYTIPKALTEIKDYFPEQTKAMQEVADSVVNLVREKDQTYRGSWKARGGRGAWFTLVRPIDRLQALLKTKHQDDIFAALVSEDSKGESGKDGSVMACITDIIGYLLLVRSWFLLQKNPYHIPVRHTKPTSICSSCSKAFTPIGDQKLCTNCALKFTTGKSQLESSSLDFGGQSTQSGYKLTGQDISSSPPEWASGVKAVPVFMKTVDDKPLSKEEVQAATDYINDRTSVSRLEIQLYHLLTDETVKTLETARSALSASISKSANLEEVEHAISLIDFLLKPNTKTC